MERLDSSEVHVWYILAPREIDDRRAARYRALLTPEERERLERFVQEKDRRQYLLGKVLVRTMLSYYHPLAPDMWRFAANSFGKPIVQGAPASLRFNLSHTDGLIACAVARDFEVGIDVENVTRPVNLDIARRFFAPAEVAFLEQVPEPQRQRTFFFFWTLKEAYVKARGMGLSLPLEQFAFRLAAGQDPDIRFDPALDDDPAAWRFFLPEVPSPSHQMALAVQYPRADLKIVLRSLPLDDPVG